MASPAARVSRVDLKRHPDLRRVYLARGKLETLRHDADYCALVAVQHCVLSNNLRIAAECALPQSCRYDGNTRCASFVVVGREQPARNRIHAQGFEQSTGHK